MTSGTSHTQPRPGFTDLVNLSSCQATVRFPTTSPCGRTQPAPRASTVRSRTPAPPGPAGRGLRARADRMTPGPGPGPNFTAQSDTPKP
eukprot:139258-Hanusia_phi.AAC.1